MACSCDHGCEAPKPDSRFRKALWVALFINAVMFTVEIGGSAHSGSSALLADALDFLGDAANYGISLFVLALGALWRARAALLKGATMGLFGLFVIGQVVYGFYSGRPPEAATMGLIGFLALLANGSVALMLYAFRDGDANMRSVWLCSRNDALGNIAVMLAAAGVFGTGSAWPDLLVAAIMAGLALSAAYTVLRQARAEIRAERERAPLVITAPVLGAPVLFQKSTEGPR